MWRVTILWHFFLRCCVKITEFACYNKTKWKGVPSGGGIFAVLLWNNSVSAQKRFSDYFSMKFHLLDGILRFLKHAPPLEIFGSKLRVFLQFPLLGERELLIEMI